MSTVGAILGLLCSLLVMVAWIIINNAVPFAIGGWFDFAALLMAGIVGVTVYLQTRQL